MFLNQKLNYTISDDLNEMVEKFSELQPNYIVYDTETTGLDVIKDKPFLYAVGFHKFIYIFEPTPDNLDIFHKVARRTKMVLAHNAKYDYHMSLNMGLDLSDCKLGDTMTIARLTQYADVNAKLGLEAIGERYVDPSSKFAGKVIQKHINDINKNRRKELRDYIKLNYPKEYSSILEAYDNRVQYLPHTHNLIFSQLDSIYKKPTYFDSYLEKPTLMRQYLADDLVIMLEYLEKVLPVLKKVDPDLKTFRRESRLISQVANMERVGLTADIDYLLERRQAIIEYIEKVYKKLHEKIGSEITVGQHKKIKEIFKVKFEIHLDKSDIQALNDVKKFGNEQATEVAELIVHLRHIEKVISTYIEGMLNRIIDGKIYTNVNNAGAVSGRVSSDMQQQSKEALEDLDGNELFHPRKVFINPKDYTMYYFDYSQMELRMQAQYTIDISGGDKNLCRAYIPFECKSFITGDTFDVHNPIHLAEWDSGEWANENNEPWTPSDLHTITTLTAFPNLTMDHPEFDHYRKYGKIANFLKNYGGGIGAIMDQLSVTEDIAKALDEGYYKAFPAILDYQKWVTDNLFKYGYIENRFGRRYYMQNSRLFYKAINYVIQGGCADLLKDRQIAVEDFLKYHKLKSKLLLPVHDEIQILIHKDEEHVVSQIKKIMQDVDQYMPNIPMICDVEKTDTNWAEKYKVRV
jgi:DNA polymerase-1